MKRAFSLKAVFKIHKGEYVETIDKTFPGFCRRLWQYLLNLPLSGVKKVTRRSDSPNSFTLIMIAGEI